MSNFALVNRIVSYASSSGIFRGFVTTTFWSGLSKIILVFLTLYCTNTLSKTDFGTFSFIKNTLNFLIVFCATNFSGLCVKFTAEAKDSQTSLKRLYLLFLFTFSITIFFIFLMIFLPDKVVLAWLKNIEVLSYIKISIILMPLFMIQPFVTAILRGLKHFKLAGQYDTIASIICICFVVGLTILYGVHGTIWGVLLYYLVYSLMGVLILIKINSESTFFRKAENVFSEKNVLIRMILPVFLLSFIEAPLFWLGQTIVAAHSSYAAVGALTVIMQIGTFLMLLPTYFLQTFTPFVTELNSHKNHKEYYWKFTHLIKLLIPISVLVSILSCIIGKYLLGIFNESYIEDVSAFRISMIYFPLWLLSIILKVNLLIKEHQIYMLFISIASAIIFLACLNMLIFIGIESLHSFFYALLFFYAIQSGTALSVFIKDKKRDIV